MRSITPYVSAVIDDYGLPFSTRHRDNTIPTSFMRSRVALEKIRRSYPGWTPDYIVQVVGSLLRPELKKSAEWEASLKFYGLRMVTATHIFITVSAILRYLRMDKHWALHIYMTDNVEYEGNGACSGRFSLERL